MTVNACNSAVERKACLCEHMLIDFTKQSCLLPKRLVACQQFTWHSFLLPVIHTSQEEIKPSTYILHVFPACQSNALLIIWSPLLLHVQAINCCKRVRDWILLLLIFQKQKLSNWLPFSLKSPGACFLCLQWRLLAGFAAYPWVSTLQAPAV